MDANMDEVFFFWKSKVYNAVAKVNRPQDTKIYYQIAHLFFFINNTKCLIWIICCSLP